MAADPEGAAHAAVRERGLVRVADLRGDLHTHTDLTDGIVSLEGMIAAAEERGYEYYAVTDRAPNLVMQRMTSEKMLAQRDELRALADTTGMVLLHGSELNIAADGSVDWDEDFLSGFDLCVASIQSENRIPAARPGKGRRVRGFMVVGEVPGHAGPGGCFSVSVLLRPTRATRARHSWRYPGATPRCAQDRARRGRCHRGTAPPPRGCAR
jgi:PHP domain